MRLCLWSTLYYDVNRWLRYEIFNLNYIINCDRWWRTRWLNFLCDARVNYSFIHVDSLIVLNIFPRVMSNAVCVVNQLSAVELFYAITYFDDEWITF